MSLVELLHTTSQSLNREENRIYGVVTGIVQDIKDPLGLGRIKVNFPWLAEKKEAVNIKDDDRAQSY